VRIVSVPRVNGIGNELDTPGIRTEDDTVESDPCEDASVACRSARSEHTTDRVPVMWATSEHEST